MDIYLKGTFFVSQAVALNMVRNKKCGSIVHVSSQASQAALKDHSLYGMSKAALDNLAKNMALELGFHVIRVNCVNPTVVMTELSPPSRLVKSSKSWVNVKCNTSRLFSLDENEVVGPVLFLLSGSSDIINGNVVPVDGGYLAT